MAFAWLNGRIQPLARVGIGWDDAGFVWGAVVVDNARTHGGRLTRWADHLARFRADCQACFVPLLVSDTELTAAARELIRLNRQDGDLHVVTFATPGPPEGPPTIGIRTYPVREERNRRWREQGVALVPAVNPHHPVGSAATAFVSPTVKHRSRLAWWIAERANTIQDTIPVFFDHARQTFTETAIANLFAVKDGEVVSPPPELVLDGITKRAVRELCQSLGIPLRCGTIATLRRDHWDELFLAGTGCDIVRVARIVGDPAIFGRTVSDRLIEAWTRLFV